MSSGTDTTPESTDGNDDTSMRDAAAAELCTGTDDPKVPAAPLVEEPRGLEETTSAAVPADEDEIIIDLTTPKRPGQATLFDDPPLSKRLVLYASTSPTNDPIQREGHDEGVPGDNAASGLDGDEDILQQRARILRAEIRRHQASIDELQVYSLFSVCGLFPSCPFFLSCFLAITSHFCHFDVVLMSSNPFVYFGLVC